jgi:hypothetical protein
MEPADKKTSSESNPQELFQLADEYKRAAETEAARLKKEKHTRMSWAPFRLCAIHATELYLNAFLLHKGETEATVRSLQHKLGERTLLAEKHGLRLKGRTIRHLHKIEENREYLMTRYNPNMKNASEINRLTATLEDVREKAAAVIFGDSPR